MRFNQQKQAINHNSAARLDRTLEMIAPLASNQIVPAENRSVLAGMLYVIGQRLHWSLHSLLGSALSLHSLQSLTPTLASTYFRSSEAKTKLYSVTVSLELLPRVFDCDAKLR